MKNAASSEAAFQLDRSKIMPIVIYAFCRGKVSKG